MCTIINHCPLNYLKIKTKLNILDILALDLEHMSEKEINEDIELYNYKEIVVNVNGNNYKIFHGFPGDGCVAVIYFHEELIIDLNHNFNINDVLLNKQVINDIIQIKKWYNDVTDNGSNWSLECFI